VIQLVKARIPDETIVTIIRASKVKIDTTEVGLAELLRAGATSQVIAALLAAPPPVPSGAAPGGSGDLIEISMERHVGDAVQLVRLFEASFTRGIDVGFFSVGEKTVVPGKSARDKADEPRPTFRVKAANEGVVRRLLLTKFGESDEGGRQLNAESSEQFDIQTTGADTFIVRPRKDLKRGEYCLYLVSGEKTMIFDFSIGGR